MTRTKIQIPVARATAESVARPVLRAAASHAPKPAAAKAAPKPIAGETRQVEVNHTPDFVAAGIVPHGKPVAAGRVELVGPEGMFSPPSGFDLRCFLHRDGTGVKFAGAAGDVFLDRQEAQSEFGTLLPSALALLAAHAVVTRDPKPKPKPAPAKPAAPIRRAAETTTAPIADAATAVSHATERSSSTPLPTATRTKLESSYGADLGQVKVHTDTEASAAAHAVHAHAFTTGQDIYFRAGQYNPGTAGGNKLLAHEVAHTVQQGPSGDTVARQAESPNLQISEPGDRVEREAEAAADRAVRGQPASLRSTGPGVSRLADSPTPMAAPQSAPAPKAVEKPVEKKAEKPAAGAAPGGAAPGGAAPGGEAGAAPVGAAVAAEKKPESKAPAAPDGAKPGAATSVSPAAGPSEGLQSVVAGVSGAGKEQQAHDPAAKKADEARASVGVTAEQAVGDGQASQLNTMAAAKPDAKKGFNKEEFKARLQKKISDLQNEDAKAVRDGDKAAEINAMVKGEVAVGKAAAAGDLPAKVAQEPPKGQLTPGPAIAADKPAPAPVVDGSKAVPVPVPDAAVSMTPATTAVDASMADAKITPEQLRKANEPSFTAAADARDAAHAQAEALPVQARSAESKTLARAATLAATATQAGLVGSRGRAPTSSGRPTTNRPPGPPSTRTSRRRSRTSSPGFTTRPLRMSMRNSRSSTRT